GHWPGGRARDFAAAGGGAGRARALLLAVSGGPADRPGLAAAGETDEAASVLTAAGWRVATATADMPLSVAWDVLNRSHLARGAPAPARAAREAGAPGAAGP